MSYLPYPENITSMTELFRYNNKITCINRATSADIANCASAGGLFAPALLIGIFFFIFILLKAYRSEEAFAVASFFTMIASWMFWIMQLVPEVFPLVLTLLTAGSIFFLKKS